MRSRNRLAQRVGRRGAALLFFGWLDVIYAHGLIFPPAAATTSQFYRFLAEIAPLWVWGGLWGLTGVACFVYAFRVRDRLGFAAAMFLKVLWGATALLAWAFAGVDRGYVSAAIWLAAAGWIAIISSWPEPPSYDLREAA